MCAYYDDEITKIKKGDQANYQNQAVEILSVTHVKSNKTMNIQYLIEGKYQQLPIIVYHGKIANLQLIERVKNA